MEGGKNYLWFQFKTIDWNIEPFTVKLKTYVGGNRDPSGAVTGLNGITLFIKESTTRDWVVGNKAGEDNRRVRGGEEEGIGGRPNAINRQFWVYAAHKVMIGDLQFTTYAWLKSKENGREKILMEWYWFLSYQYLYGCI